MAITCNNCGYAYNNDDAERCSICNSVLGMSGEIVSMQDSGLIEQPVSEIDNLRPDAEIISEPAAVIEDRDSRHFGRDILEGRISHLERYDEKPPLDAFNIASKIMIGILIAVPFIFLFVCSGIISLVFAVTGFHALSQLFNPIIWTTAIAELLEILVLRRIRGTDTVPVYRGMIEDANSREHAFWFRGPVKSGNLIVSHNVRLSGKWQGGTFLVQHGADLDSNSDILSRYRNPWKYIFFILLAIYLALGIKIYCQFPEIEGWMNWLKV